MAYSKNPNSMFSSSRAACAIRLPGAPIRERFPPMAAANTSGISRRDLLYPDFAAIPITTGIRTAAVPVLDNTPLINPTITMMATISIRSLFANFDTISPTLFAIPVSNSAPPTINIDTNKITLLSINPENAVFASNTPVSTKPIQTIIEVSPRGIFSSTNITTANAKNSSVMVDGLICNSSLYLFRFCPFAASHTALPFRSG